jgi:hypothetical protein
MSNLLVLIEILFVIGYTFICPVLIACQKHIKPDNNIFLLQELFLLIGIIIH